MVKLETKCTGESSVSRSSFTMSRNLQQLRKRKLWLVQELEAVLLELCLERNRKLNAVTMDQDADGPKMVQGPAAPKRKSKKNGFKVAKSSPPSHYKNMRVVERDHNEYDKTM